MVDADSRGGDDLRILLAGIDVSVSALQRMQPAEVGMLLVSGFSTSDQREFSIPNIRAHADASAYELERSAGRRRRPKEYDELDLPQVLADACAWLIARGLIGPASENSGSGGEFRLTTEGLAAAREGSGAHVEAAMRLHADLHPALSEARLNFERGSYQTAVFEATRQVEVRVRDLSGLGADTYGVQLMHTAFNPDNGPLTTGEVAAEKKAIASLFAGTIGAFKNASGHRVVHFEDPSEAADIIHLADLLLRIVERAAGETKKDNGPTERRSD
ncbi:TIGR02391 family protein [uncultured Microbacterium sp.]|uniref:TIGR02391 family protein n=1 Tax=uncultured Microbacterium sp. TaxID=191216 RepID=UPI0028DCA6A6|nr:TIGR02391 family protein [uncultured Microbacterium sp.]